LYTISATQLYCEWHQINIFSSLDLLLADAAAAAAADVCWYLHRTDARTARPGLPLCLVRTIVLML